MEQNVTERMRQVKRRFFAMRNGITADHLRRSGMGYRIIFGLNLPQIAEIAADFSPDDELADALWANSTTRESRLMAPMLYDHADIIIDKALAMASQTAEIEEADVLCHRLLRHLPFAHSLPSMLLADNTGRALTRYAGLRLITFLAATGDKAAYLHLARAEASSGNPATSRLAAMIADDLSLAL